jgi:hypothetical protein
MIDEQEEGAARPEQREELTFRDRQRDPVHCPDPVEALADALEGDADASALGHGLRV